MPTQNEIRARTARKLAASLGTFQPIGTHTENAALSSAVTLTPSDGRVNAIMMQPHTKDIRYTLDGTDPTASKGFLLTTLDEPRIIYYTPGVILKVIEIAASATLEYQYGRIG